MKLQPRYYYNRDENRHPVETVCLLTNTVGDIVSKGVAKCCPQDSPKKSIGRDIAYGRALKAAEEGFDLVNESGFKRGRYLPPVTVFESRICKGSGFGGFERGIYHPPGKVPNGLI